MEQLAQSMGALESDDGGGALKNCDGVEGRPPVIDVIESEDAPGVRGGFVSGGCEDYDIYCSVQQSLEIETTSAAEQKVLCPQQKGVR